MMFKKICVLFVFLILVSSFMVTISAVDVNGIDFKIPNKYLGGETKSDGYQLENIFGIFCIDDNLPQRVGFWASESDHNDSLDIDNHPVRYYYSYNQYVSDNMSHAYFSSGNSFYEIFWVGNQITPDIEKLIKDTPDSEIGNDSFNSIVDNAIDTYIKDRDDQLSYDSLYNDYEARSSSKSGYGKTNYDRLREGYITFYNNRYH